MISSNDFIALQKLLQERAGMFLGSDKLYLVASRLSPVAQRLGLRGVIELMEALRDRPREDMVQAVIEAMVTHESLFFRDEKPFEHLANVVLPALVQARAQRRSIRIWSAACSSGQEAYSIAMVILERFAHLAGWNWEVVGSDISLSIVQKARSGVFSAFEVKRGLSDERLNRHFRKVESGNFAVADQIRRLVRFETHNLLESATRLGVFDVVFCRNVLIYFDASTKARAIDLILRQMAPDGTLFLGSADNILSTTSALQPAGLERGVFKPALAPQTRQT
jgi:chemotaxis protein methyltransferase CheR